MTKVALGAGCRTRSAEWPDEFEMGLRSVGVKCQYTGITGRIEKSQVAGFLSLAGPVEKEASMSMLFIFTAVNVAPRCRPSLYCQS
jgi:hypothetical protein